MKIDTSTGWLGEVAAAWAMPSSKWRAPSIEAPYTDTTAPAVRNRKLRLSIPVPAGTQFPAGKEANGSAILYASGSGTAVVQPTGRNFIGLNEYTVAVSWSTPVTLVSGEYWFNVTPACTNGTSDGSCSVGRIFFSNTTNRANGVNGEAQTEGQLYLNSSFFGFTWANWCDSALGFNKIQCAGGSYGLIGAAGGN